MDKYSAFVSSYAILIFMKIVCFIIGYLVVRLGYDLLKRGITGEFKFSTEVSRLKIGLASVSPGLLFVLLGCLIIGYAMFVEKEIRFEDSFIENSILNELAPVEKEPLPPAGQTGGKK